MTDEIIRFGSLRFRIQVPAGTKFFKLSDWSVQKMGFLDFPLTPYHARQVLRACNGEERFKEIEESTELCRLAQSTSSAQARAIVRDDRIYVSVPTIQKDDLKAAIDSARWEANLKAWWLPASSASAAAIVSALYKVGVFPDSEFQKLLDQQKSADEAKTADDLPNPDGINKELWTHQKRAYHFAKNMTACMLAMGMGTGKTLTTIALILEAKRTLIFCPKHVVQVWKREFHKHVSDRLPLICELTDSKVSNRIIKLKKAIEIADSTGQNLVVVMNYESVNSTRSAKTDRKKLQDFLLLKVYWDFIIYDESHRIKTPGSNTSKFCSQLKKVSAKRIQLTGTPFHNNATDIFGQFRALDESIFGTSFARFKRRYTETNPWGGISAIINEEELNERFYRLAYRVTSDILDLPDGHTIELKCELEPRARKIYDRLEEQFIAEIADGTLTVANGAVKLIRLLQLSGGWLKNDDDVFEQVSTSKASLLREVLNDFPNDEPLMIVGYFSRDLQTIHDVCESVGRTTSEVSGKASQYEEWRAGKTNVLVGQIKSVGVGIDCTRSSAMIVYSTGLVSPGDIDQLQRRVLRPGQTKNVRFFYLLNKATRDVDVYRGLRNKEANIARVIMQQIKDGRES